MAYVIVNSISVGADPPAVMNCSVQHTRKDVARQNWIVPRADGYFRPLGREVGFWKAVYIAPHWKETSNDASPPTCNFASLAPEARASEWPTESLAFSIDLSLHVCRYVCVCVVCARYHRESILSRISSHSPCPHVFLLANGSPHSEGITL